MNNLEILILSLLKTLNHEDPENLVSGRQIFDILSSFHDSLLPGDVATTLWKLNRDGRIQILTNLKVRLT